MESTLLAVQRQTEKTERSEAKRSARRGEKRREEKKRESRRLFFGKRQAKRRERAGKFKVPVISAFVFGFI